MNIILVTGVFSLACWVLFILFFRKDRSRYRNCYLLAFALLSMVPFLINLIGPYSRLPLLIVINGIMLIILIVPFFLIFNGIVMIRKEGRHLSQLLSLILGLLILAGEAIALGGLFRYAYSSNVTDLVPRTVPGVLAAVFCVSVIYGSVTFLVFMIYTLFLQIIPRNGNSGLRKTPSRPNENAIAEI